LWAARCPAIQYPLTGLPLGERACRNQPSLAGINVRTTFGAKGAFFKAMDGWIAGISRLKRAVSAHPTPAVERPGQPRTALGNPSPKALGLKAFGDQKPADHPGRIKRGKGAIHRIAPQRNPRSRTPAPHQAHSTRWRFTPAYWPEVRLRRPTRPPPFCKAVGRDAAGRLQYDIHTTGRKGSRARGTARAHWLARWVRGICRRSARQ